MSGAGDCATDYTGSFFAPGFLATFLAAGSAALLLLVFVCTHVVFCCQRLCGPSGDNIGPAGDDKTQGRARRASSLEAQRARRATLDLVRLQLGKKTSHEVQLGVVAVLSGLSGMVSTQVAIP
jgi:hypothetical protein